MKKAYIVRDPDGNEAGRYSIPYVRMKNESAVEIKDLRTDESVIFHFSSPEKAKAYKNKTAKEISLYGEEIQGSKEDFEKLQKELLQFVQEHKNAGAPKSILDILPDEVITEILSKTGTSISDIENGNIKITAILIPIKEFAEGKLPSPEDFLSMLEELITKQDGNIESILSSGHKYDADSENCQKCISKEFCETLSTIEAKVKNDSETISEEPKTQSTFTITKEIFEAGIESGKSFVVMDNSGNSFIIEKSSQNRSLVFTKNKIYLRFKGEESVKEVLEIHEVC